MWKFDKRLQNCAQYKVKVKKQLKINQISTKVSNIKKNLKKMIFEII